MTDSKPECISCNRGDQETPLIKLTFQSTNYWICPQHMPLLIHNPAQLIGKLPGADKLKPAG